MSKTIVALMYDFDKTLCTENMQEYTFIPGVKMTSGQFWSLSDSLAKEEKADSVLAYMRVMLETAHSAHKSIRREDFVMLGKDLEFFKGVESWFERINKIGEANGVLIEHYIISSGLREIIEGSSIYKNFKEVFACEYLYDENRVACWPKNVVNYTTKTQFLFRINKGILDLSDDKSLNSYVSENSRRVPFRNMIYIADGITDVPCMKLVKVNGGSSIAVYSGENSDSAEMLLRDERVDFALKADYSEGGELEKTVKEIIEKAAITDRLIKKTAEQKVNLR